MKDQGNVFQIQEQDTSVETVLKEMGVCGLLESVLK